MMEAYAGFLAHTDAQIGRLIQSLKDSQQFDNTLFVYIVGDNGGSGEGGLLGGVNYMGELQGLPEPVSRKLQRLDDIGGPDSYSNYPAGWAWAMNTPFQWIKQIASHLGATRNPMVLSWPKGIKASGELREQFSHVNDLVPTILEAAGIKAPASVNGVKQLPMDGTSLLYSFNDATAPERHTTQYFEVSGNRAIYHNGWMASAFHGRMPWTVGVGGYSKGFEEDRWELYDLRNDFSQARDLANEQPKRLKQMQARFTQETKRVGIFPLRDASDVRTPMPNLIQGRKIFTYYPGAVAIPESAAPPMFNISWGLQADLQLAASGAQGVIATIGGTGAGWSLYLDQSGTPVFEYRVFEVTRQTLKAKSPLSPGQHNLNIDFVYDGGGYGKGGLLSLTVDGKKEAEVRLAATPPAFFSIDETFDLGIDTGSPAGTYPANAELGYPLTNGTLNRVTVEVK
jgi:arylsulfatase